MITRALKWNVRLNCVSEAREGMRVDAISDQCRPAAVISFFAPEVVWAGYNFMVTR